MYLLIYLAISSLTGSKLQDQGKQMCPKHLAPSIYQSNEYVDGWLAKRGSKVSLHAWNLHLVGQWGLWAAL